MPPVSAVVVNHNGGERVLGVVRALLRQDYRLAEIVVVDSGSSDGSAARIRCEFPEVRVLELRANLGPCHARNLGLRTLATPLALLIDSDVYVEEGTVSALVEAQCAEAAAVVCPRIRFSPERELIQAEGAAVHFTGTLILRHNDLLADKTPRSRSDVGGCISACLLVDRARAIEAGGFDELFFFYFEDLEFSLRMRALGHRFLCEPRAEVLHERGGGTPGLSFRGAGAYPVRRAHLHMRNRLLTMLIHYRFRTMLLLLPALLLFEVAVLLEALRRGWLGPWFDAWRWQLRHSGEIRDRRRRMRDLRKLPDRELLVGGPIPLAKGMMGSELQRRMAGVLSSVLDRYWRIARNGIN